MVSIFTIRNTFDLTMMNLNTILNEQKYYKRQTLLSKSFFLQFINQTNKKRTSHNKTSLAVTVSNPSQTCLILYSLPFETET